jgi:microsomal dipeptidase-like Zn-dependent dipeptidase
VIVDLHAHYPMQLVPDGPDAVLEAMTTREGRRRWRDRFRARLVRLLSLFGNWRSAGSGPRVTVDKMRAGGVGVALSVLYSPFDEMDIGPAYGSPPHPDYFPRLLSQLDLVEERLGPGARIATTPEQLDDAVQAGELALVHAVEGGFHLPPGHEQLHGAVAQLAARGVAYITIAHLFWRQVATNTNAIPFLPDRVYAFLFPQPKLGLTQHGRELVRAMVRQGILVDLAHCTPAATQDVFAILDEVDPGEQVPVLNSHAGHRFGRQEYMVDDATMERIARRGGVVGLIHAQHQLNDGLRRRRSHEFQESCEVLVAHIDRLAQVTGNHDHIAVGTDFDGFIKPTLAGLEDSADLAKLPVLLGDRYGDEVAAKILSGNALRMLRAGWGVKRTA